MSGSDGSAKKLAEPETGVHMSELSVDTEYVLVVFDAWHDIFLSTCSWRHSMSDANDAQYDWPCNALPCFNLATGGIDAETQAIRWSQNDHGMSCGRADSFTHTFESYPMCACALQPLQCQVNSRLVTPGQQRRFPSTRTFLEPFR